jgi:hypothetical protein
MRIFTGILLAISLILVLYDFFIGVESSNTTFISISFLIAAAASLFALVTLNNTIIIIASFISLFNLLIAINSLADLADEAYIAPSECARMKTIDEQLSCFDQLKKSNSAK